MSPNTSSPLDLDAYFRRTGYTGDRTPTSAVLEGIHLAHALHIPFENLDILLGRPIRLDIESVQAKLVRDRRGGYCFEQNTLLAAVLEQIGFRVTRLAARVRLGSTRVAPRTHKLLKVEADGASWLADVGFGAAGLLQPLPMVAGLVTQQFAWSYRLLEESGAWLLQHLQEGQWSDQYVFTLEPQAGIDYELANYYTSTHPESRFTQTLAVQRPTPDKRYRLINRDLTHIRPDGSDTRTLGDETELLAVLAAEFGLAFPAQTHFRVPFPDASTLSR